MNITNSLRRIARLSNLLMQLDITEPLLPILIPLEASRSMLKSVDLDLMLMAVVLMEEEEYVAAVEALMDVQGIKGEAASQKMEAEEAASSLAEEAET